MKKELDTLRSMNVWKVETLPKGTKAIPLMWRFRIKRQDGETIYKSRLVARGDLEPLSLTGSFYAPVSSGMSLRVLLTLASKTQAEVHAFDVKGAFLNAVKDPSVNPVFVKGTVGIDTPPGTGLLLLRSLYGLRSSPFEWSREMTSRLLRIGFTPCEREPATFKYIKDGELKSLCVSWVDDILVLLPTDDEDLKAKLEREIPDVLGAKDRGVIDENGLTYLGCRIRRVKTDGKTEFHMDQQHYVDRMLDDYELKDLKPFSVPASVSDYVSSEDSDLNGINPRSLIGSIMFLSNWCRPDVSFAISRAAQCQEHPDAATRARIKYALRYLASAPDLRLVISATPTGLDDPLMISGYSDASFATGDDKKSQSGMVIFLENGAVYWGSKRQRYVTTSSAEAELTAASELTQQVIGLTHLLDDLGVPYSKPKVYVDNSAVVQLSSTAVLRTKLKHVATRALFVREQHQLGVIEVCSISGEWQIADLFTKALPPERFQMLRSSFMSD
jgi:hypothetical protein